MVRSRQTWGYLVGFAIAMGCGGRTTQHEPGAAGSSGAGAATAPTLAPGGISSVDGAPAASGGNDGTASGGNDGTGVGGGSATETSGPAGSAGATPLSVPGQTERESEILAPLWTDDETIADATGEKLLGLATAIGLARGYAMCRCALSPKEPPESIDELIRSCAVEETAVRLAHRPDEARCLTERMNDVEGADEHIRCLARRARPLGTFEFSVCETGMRGDWPMVEDCEARPEVYGLINECRRWIYCADGSSVAGSRCDLTAECPDQSDERRCLEEWGRDFVICGDEFLSPRELCSSSCGMTHEPPLCNPMRPDRFSCGDGGDVHIDVVCDRTQDCPDGQDEAYCFR